MYQPPEPKVTKKRRATKRQKSVSTSGVAKKCAAHQHKVSNAVIRDCPDCYRRFIRYYTDENEQDAQEQDAQEQDVHEQDAQEQDVHEQDAQEQDVHEQDAREQG